MLKKSKKRLNLGKIDIKETDKPPENISQKKYKLERKANIQTDGREIEISYDDLEKQRFIAQGRFGTCLQMHHKPSGIIFAVKKIPDHPEYQNDKNTNDEIMDLTVPLLAGDNPYLVKYYGALHAEHYVWILNELMDTSFDFFYKKCVDKKIKMPLDLMSKLSYSILNAIKYLKSKNILHRDIKPSNFLMNYTSEIKLCDFGVSGKTKNSVADTLEKGCLPYMPKEKISDPDKEKSEKTGYSVKSDVWSLGISLVEIATGEHPYHKINYPLMQIREIIDGQPPRLNENYDALLCKFIERSLQKEENDRMSPDDLLNQDFIKHYYPYESLDKNLIKEIIDSIREDNIKSQS